MSDGADFLTSLKKAREYGLEAFLEIMSELSQESIKRGTLDRKTKELITLGIALTKGCNRCIQIHAYEARRLGATDREVDHVERIALFMQASPTGKADMWAVWQSSWREYVLSRAPITRHTRELTAIGIALVKQHPDLIELHVRSALQLGATPTQVFEIMPIALLMDGAPALSQIPHLVKAIESGHLTLAENPAA